MDSQPFQFLATSLIAQCVWLGWIISVPPRCQPFVLGKGGWLAISLTIWWAALLFRGAASSVHLIWATVPAILGVALLDPWVRVRFQLRFVPSGVSAFDESDSSGRCMDTGFSRISGARSGLRLTVTADELWIRPQRARTLFATARGLIHRVPLRRIHLMERLAGPGNNIRLEYEGEDGWCRCVELRLKNPAVFIEAIREGQLEGLD